MQQPTTTGQALLGLLAIRPFTAYELTKQMNRALRWAWPRSEANLYHEIKRLVPMGLARAIEEESGRRSRTRYEITEAGREAVKDWLASPLAGRPQVQFETLLRVFLADRGESGDLQRSIAETREQVLGAMGEVVPVLEDYASDPPFPERAHLNVLFIHFTAGFMQLLLRWCDDAEAEIATWQGRTAGIGFTPGTERMLDEALAFYRETLERHGWQA